MITDLIILDEEFGVDHHNNMVLRNLFGNAFDNIVIIIINKTMFGDRKRLGKMLYQNHLYIFIYLYRMGTYLVISSESRVKKSN